MTFTLFIWLAGSDLSSYTTVYTLHSLSCLYTSWWLSTNPLLAPIVTFLSCAWELVVEELFCCAQFLVCMDRKSAWAHVTLVHHQSLFLFTVIRHILYIVLLCLSDNDSACPLIRSVKTCSAFACFGSEYVSKFALCVRWFVVLLCIIISVCIFILDKVNDHMKIDYCNKNFKCVNMKQYWCYWCCWFSLVP